ncbi:MAG TPA: putative hydro-lyase [Symbiobacteriaceae bacterium]|nr:putative hydro-lyase [Symbiobacteriaceae bacterium]
MYKTPREVWLACREGAWDRPTAGLAPGYAQANLVILPTDDAFDFLRLAQRNPKPIPVLEVLETGDWEPKLTAPGADLRTDVPRYRVYKHGEFVEERLEIRDLWRDDLVAFLIGCSFTFEKPLIDAGLPIRHIECGCNVPMYRTNRMCVPAGRFSGPMVVSMRPIPAHLVAKAVTVTARYPAVHGAPVHIGEPEALGIADINRPDWGDAVPIRPGEVPVFWACGVTPQAVAIQSRPEFMITHAPGHMFITNLLDEQVASN